jgi:membrane-bound serine protease (ClpP class)
MALFTAVLLAIFVLPSPWGAVAIVGGTLVEVGEAWAWIRWSQRRRAHVGVEALVGETARVVSACAPLGQVRIRGELWRARCDAGADEGESVRVTAIDDLTLVVERA